METPTKPTTLLYSTRLAERMSRKDAIEEIERELRQRAYLYPRAIARGNMGTALAMRQYTALQAALDYLKGHREDA